MLSSRCNYWWDDAVAFGLSVATAPTAEPVTVHDVKANARIDTDEEDTWILGKIAAARGLAETFIKRTFCTTSLRLSLDAFPAWEFYLPRPNLLAVTSVKYIDESGGEVTIPSNEYIVDTYRQPGRITPAYNTNWPTARNQANAVEVIYTAGYGAPAVVPQPIKDAIVMIVTQWYENRGDDGNRGMSVMPLAAKSLLRSCAWGYLP